MSLDTAKANFERYGLLDGQVRFLKGRFSETLRSAPIGRLAVLRLDGDLYESTLITLMALYNRVSAGGYIIVDDDSLAPCRQAVEDFRREPGIAEAVWPIDWTGVFWQKISPGQPR